MATNALPSIHEPVVDRFGRWTSVWWRWVRPLFDTVKASADDLVSVTATIDAVAGQWSIQVNVDNRVTAAITLDGSEAESVFAVLADKFVIVHPSDNDTELEAFIVGEVDTVTTVGVNGNVVVDDTILARHIDVDDLEAISADFGTVIAGKLQRADGAMVVDLDNKKIVITNGGYRLYADGVAGAIAIYTVPSDDSTDDTPLTAPLSHIGRLQFHSDLPAPGIVKVGGNFANTGSISIGSASANTAPRTVHQLLAHGRGGIPMVFGKITIGGSQVPLCGSVPLDLEAGTGFGRWAHLGADATYVLLDIAGIAGPSGLSSASLSWEVYVTNIYTDGTVESDPDDKLIRINASMFTANYGQFDSRRRYLRNGAVSGTNLPMVSGKTIDINAIDGAGNNDPGHALRYSVDGYTKQFTPTVTVQPSTFVASFTRIKF